MHVADIDTLAHGDHSKAAKQKHHEEAERDMIEKNATRQLHKILLRDSNALQSSKDIDGVEVSHEPFLLRDAAVWDMQIANDAGGGGAGGSGPGAALFD